MGSRFFVSSYEGDLGCSRLSPGILGVLIFLGEFVIESGEQPSDVAIFHSKTSRFGGTAFFLPQTMGTLVKEAMDVLSEQHIFSTAQNVDNGLRPAAFGVESRSKDDVHMKVGHENRCNPALECGMALLARTNLQADHGR